MAAVYAQPAAANYFTAPSHPTPKQRGYRVCDKCGAVEQPHNRFRLCGGCMATQYCSQDCQKAHWPSHKAICQHTASQISSAKQPSFGAVDENLVKSLRKFVSTHNLLLSWAGFQALQLKRVPSNIRQHALLVELSYRPSATDSLRRFSVKSTHVVPRTYVTDNDPLVGEDIHRREDRCRKSGGIGCAVILVQCGEISQVMPVEVDSPSRISWDMRDDWSEVLQHFVDSGRTDFKPISTTARGIVYG
ncbi:hypothetical protein BD309DRAFT_964818 [Dichomitus squalens]|uniref:MYND-type domain-containing protein n=2 Tax=Dichomitus squalens TaxID=114155 RepID=A0A4V2K7B1_9APHY|nr:hypothetical protein BD311DRAFT_766513 [Dichomitus squalens]TBU41643.1 hypothetical protein BD309DRAFT_964818 [Dichomitus squalens]TBU55448.1 hypothetical protein BD310DRAFT_933669 [Dichomitus squalens]